MTGPAHRALESVGPLNTLDGIKVISYPWNADTYLSALEVLFIVIGVVVLMIGRYKNHTGLTIFEILLILFALAYSFASI